MNSQTNSHEAEALYTRRTGLYDVVFLKLFHYEDGICAFLQKSDYLRPGFRVLDAGCGSGAVTKAMYRIAKRDGVDTIAFDAFDLTQSMLDVFQTWLVEQDIHGVRLARADVLDAHQLPPDWNGYDLLVSSAMLEYIPKAQLRAALGNLKRRLRKKAKMVVFITRKNHLMKWLIQKWWKANMYERNEIEKIFHDVGFTSIAFKRFPFPYGFLNIWGFIVEATV